MEKDNSEKVFEALDRLYLIRQRFHRGWFLSVGLAAIVGALNRFAFYSSWWVAARLSILTFALSVFWGYWRVSKDMEEWMDYCEENSIEIFEVED